MKASQLRNLLLAEGCSESNFAIQTGGSDVYCLDRRDGEWRVFYTERGIDSKPLFQSTSEEEACRFFYDLVMRMKHWHIVGFFKNAADAELLETKLASLNIEPVRNDIPAYKHQNDPRYRVFVVGMDIFKVREALGEISIDWA